MADLDCEHHKKEDVDPIHDDDDDHYEEEDHKEESLIVLITLHLLCVTVSW